PVVAEAWQRLQRREHRLVPRLSVELLHLVAHGPDERRQESIWFGNQRRQQRTRVEPGGEDGLARQPSERRVVWGNAEQVWGRLIPDEETMRAVQDIGWEWHLVQFPL